MLMGGTKLIRSPRTSTPRQILAEIMEPYQGGRDATRLSLVVDLAVLTCIVGSCTLVLLEHLGQLAPGAGHTLELVFTCIFVAEYLLRWYAAPNRLLYPLTFYAIVDLVAILPSVLLLGSDLILLRVVRGVRLLRLLRLLRLMRVLRYSYLLYSGITGLRTYLSAVNHQYRLLPLVRLLMWVVLAWFVGANALHFTERALGGPAGPFAQYWDSYWNVLIVLVSGIEDKEPLSLLGRVEVTILLVVGICVVGMLTGEIVAILVRKSQRVGMLAVKPPSARLEQHVVVLGVNSHLDNIVRQVRAALGGHHYMLIVAPEADQLRVSDAVAYRRVFGLAGNPLDERVLEQAAVDQAARVIILSPDEDGAPQERDNKALMQAIAVRGRRSKRPLVVELQTEESLSFAAPLADVDFVVSRHYGEKLISQSVLNPGVTEVYYRLMTFTEQSNEFYTIEAPDALVGQTFAEAQLYCLDEAPDEMVLVGLDRSPPDRPNTRFWLNPTAGCPELPEQQSVLRQGDRLVVIAYERPNLTEVNEDDLWSGKILQRT